MKSFKNLVLFFIIFLIQINAQDRKVIYKGMGAELVSEVDAMTDKEKCAIFVDAIGPVYLAIYGSDDYIVWAKDDDFLFSKDSQNLIRIGKNKPYKLIGLSKRNGLTPITKIEAKNVIKSLLEGEEIKLRIYKWPSYSKVDIDLQNKNLSVVYDKAIKNCNWKELGIKPTFAPVKLREFEPTDPDSKGYATVSVIGNDALKLVKGFDKYYGGCYIQVGTTETFGMQNHKWCCKQVAYKNESKIIIKDENGKVFFSENAPSTYSTSMLEGNAWPLGKKAAEICYLLAPKGSIEATEFGITDTAPLYGFKELWDWGVAKGCLISVKR